MSLLQIHKYGPVAEVALAAGTTHPITPPLLSEIRETLGNLQADPAVHALVLAAEGDKFFCIGLSIPELVHLGAVEFGEFYDLFHDTCMGLFTWPGPTVAAVTGHAVAGGCILALACDYRRIAAGHTLMGLNETLLGLPVPYAADAILRAVVGYRAARDLVDTGEFLAPEALLKVGLVDAISPRPEVRSAAREHATRLAATPPTAYAAAKRSRTQPIAAEAEARRVEARQAFVECWMAEETKERLREAAKKF